MTHAKRRPQDDSRPVPFQQFAQTLTLFILLLALALPAWSGQPEPVPAKQPLDQNGHMHFSPEDRCPVCGMKVNSHAKFAAGIQLADGTTFYFCGSGCMIRTWLHPEIFINRPRAALQKAVIREYFSGQTLDARSVIWVAGSDVIGPMGPAIVPLRDEKALETFLRRHGGKDTFVLDELNDARWFAITGKPAGR